MPGNLNMKLQRAIETFADQPGTIAVLVQSKTSPDIAAAKNATVRLPSASVIKAAIACAAADRSGLDLTQEIKVAALDETFYCSILQAFGPQDSLSLRALIGLMLIVSDNPATSAVLDAVGIDSVNTWLAKNELNDTNLDIGFDDASLGVPLRANLTTAKDCLTLLRLIDTNPAYDFVKHMLANNLRNERIPKQLPDDAVIAHKTGTLNGLVHDIATIDSPTAAYHMVVLADDLPDETDFVGKLARFSRQIYDMISA